MSFQAEQTPYFVSAVRQQRDQKKKELSQRLSVVIYLLPNGQGEEEMGLTFNVGCGTCSSWTPRTQIVSGDLLFFSLVIYLNEFSLASLTHLPPRGWAMLPPEEDSKRNKRAVLLRENPTGSSSDVLSEDTQRIQEMSITSGCSWFSQIEDFLSTWHTQVVWFVF